MYYNRDLSWVDFNERVLEEGLRRDLPLFERFRFLSIVSSNFDEFFMVRVAAIKRAQRACFSEETRLSQGVCRKRPHTEARRHGGGENEGDLYSLEGKSTHIDGKYRDYPPSSLNRCAAVPLCEDFLQRQDARIPQDARRAGDPSGLSPSEQLKAISEKVRSIVRRQDACYANDIFPGLAAEGLELVRPDSYTVPQMDFLESFFIGQIYPVLTPLRIEEDSPAQAGGSAQADGPAQAGGPDRAGASMPFFESGCINAAFLLTADNAPDDGTDAVERMAMAQLPVSLDRIIWLPSEGGKLYWALLDDVVLTWGGYLFPGYRIRESMLFKVNRDADFSVDERRDEDFIEAMEEVLEGREKSEVVRMAYSPGSVRLRDELAKRFSLESDDLYEYKGPFNACDLIELAGVAGFERLQEKPWKIYPVSGFADDVPVWDRLSHGDLMIHFPYQSFDPVIRFFQEAASDPQVISIKTTLYRTGGGVKNSQAVSPIVRALEKAALNGKHVTALVELKARFDEERNISWANRLEKAGVIVVYGLSKLKVHAKVTMVLRREHDRLKRYVHLSTGNYNNKTAKLYEDICLFTCREEIAYDVNLLFNMITGYSQKQAMQRLAIAPYDIKSRLLDLIKNEAKRAAQHYPGKIMIKCNSLTDTDVIDGLYRASQAGVNILLCVRGICSLVPGIPGLSENIRVISVIDYYLEHSRIYYFSNGGAEELYLSSADLMPRNLERRVELLFPVLDKKIHAALVDKLNAYFRDNCQARELNCACQWKRLAPAPGEPQFRIQKDMLQRAANEAAGPEPVKQEFTVRRSAPVD